MGLPEILKKNKKKAAEAFVEAIELTGANQGMDAYSFIGNNPDKNAVLSSVSNQLKQYKVKDETIEKFADFLIVNANAVNIYRDIKQKMQAGLDISEEEYKKIDDISEAMSTMNTSSMRDMLATVMNTVDTRTLSDDHILNTLDKATRKNASFKSLWGLKTFEKSNECLKLEMDEYELNQHIYEKSYGSVEDQLDAFGHGIKTIANEYSSNVSIINNAIDQLGPDAGEVTYEQIEEVREELYNINEQIRYFEKLEQDNPFALYNEFKALTESNTPDNPFYFNEKMTQAVENSRTLKTSIEKSEMILKGAEKKLNKLDKEKNELSRDIKSYQLQGFLGKLLKSQESYKKVSGEYDKLSENINIWKNDGKALKEKQEQADKDLRALRDEYRENLAESLKKYGFEKQGSDPLDVTTNGLNNIKKKVLKGLETRKNELKQNPYFDEKKFSNTKKTIEDLRNRAEEIKNGKIYKQSKLLHSISNSTKEITERTSVLENYNMAVTVGEKYTKDAYVDVMVHAQEQLNTAVLKDMTVNVKDQMASILKRLNDKKRPFHRDTKEFSDMTKSVGKLNAAFASLNDGDSVEKFEEFMNSITKEGITSIIQEIRDNAQTYVDKKKEQDRKNPSEMRVVRLDGANEIINVCNAFLAVQEKTDLQKQEISVFCITHSQDEPNPIKEKIDIPKAKELKDGVMKDFNCDPELAPEAVRDMKLYKELEKVIASRRRIIQDPEYKKYRDIQEKALRQEEKEFNFLKKKLGDKIPQEKESKPSEIEEKEVNAQKTQEAVLGPK